MAPPGYGDLGKDCSDLLSKGFHPGTVKFEAKTKTESGIKFTTNGQANMESGKALGGTELNLAWPDYGLKWVEKWNTDNQLVVDLSVEDKLVKGLKNTFVSTYNPTSNKKKGTVKTAYKNEHVNSNVDVDFDYSGPIVKASCVAGYKGWLAGYQMGFDSSKKSLTANNFAVSYSNGGNVVAASVNNGQDVNGSYYHKCSDRWVGGVSASWSAATKAAVGNLATKYTVSPDTSMKMKVSSEGQVGLSLQQKVCSCVSMTLSTVLDAKNFSAGGHRVGMSLEFEQ